MSLPDLLAVNWWEALAIFLAGVAAGTINTVVGSGTLITFPTLLAFGFPPVTANVSNDLGLVPGSISGAIGYRHELRGQCDRAVRFGAVSVLGGITGAILLLKLPAQAFQAIVPILIALAIVLVIVGPRLSRFMATRRSGQPARAGWLAYLAVYFSGIYGGYFGAAQGVLLIGILGLALDDRLQRINALKNVLAGVVNFVSAVIYIVAAPIAWGPAVLIAVGSIIGGQIGARIGRRLHPNLLRAVIVIVGVIAVIHFLLP